MKPGPRKSPPGAVAPLVLIALAVWLLLALVASQSTLWDRDEPRYATAALEMVHSGNFLYPTFNHQLRAFQPVLIYWLMAAGIELLGPGELGVRLASTIAMAMVCFLTGLIAREFLKTGAIAAILAATTPMLILTGTAATTDATLLMFILLAQWVFVRAWLDGPRRWHAPALGAAIGLAMLTKGPLGLLVPVLSIGTCLLLARGRSSPFAGKLTAAALMGTGIFLAWGLPANAATRGEYWRIAVVERLPQRVFTAMEGHGGEGLVPFLLHLPYYPLVLALGFLPWTIYLAVVPGSFGRGEFPAEDQWTRSRGGLRVLLTGMTLPVVILMTLIVSKLPHYIQPVFPWLAILLAAALDAAGAGEATRTAANRMRTAFLLFGPVGFLAAVFLIAVPWFWPPLSVFRVAGIVLGSFLAGLLLLLAWCFWRDRLLTAVKIHSAAMAIWLLACAYLVLPPLETLVKPAQLLAREIAPRIPPGASIASYGWHEGSIHFYLGARKIHHLRSPEALDEWLAVPGPQVLIFRESDGRTALPGDFQRLSSREGINIVRGSPVRLTAYLRP